MMSLFDKLPLSNETTPGPNLARIKWYRNEKAHHDSNTIDTACFNTAWNEISDMSLLILVTHNNIVFCLLIMPGNWPIHGKIRFSLLNILHG